MSIRFIVACVTLCILQLANVTFAQESRGYFGYKSGFYDYKDNGRSDSEFAHGPYVGYRLGRYVAAEIEYLRFMETSEAASFEGDTRIVSIKPTLPLGRHWELYAKFGWAWLDGNINPKKDDARAGASSESIKESFSNYGLGAGLTIGRFQGRLEYQFDKWDNSLGGPDFGVYSLGMNVNF